MSTILSPIEDINRIQIEPFPTNRQLRGARVVRVDRYVVAVDEKGRIYSTQVQAGLAYSFGCHVDATLRGIERLGLLSKAAVKQHSDLVALRNAKSARKHAAANFEHNALTLGLKLTNAQKGAIQRAKDEV